MTAARVQSGGGTRAARTDRPMSLWRLEWLRLLRTHRLLALVAVYGFFGLVSAPMARYMNEIVQRVGAGVQVIAPPATPVQGISTYVGNTNQIGLLVYTLVVASAVAFDSQREMAVFLRTRVPSYRTLLLPKYLLSVAAGSFAFGVGVVATCYGTIIFLGDVGLGGLLAGTALSMLYLAFIGAVAALLGARLNSVLTTAVATLAIALGLSIVGAIGNLGDWLPSHLLGALTSLPFDGDAGSFLRSVAVTVIATIGLLLAAAQAGGAREL